MKPIALAQQIMLFHSWTQDNNGRTGKLGDHVILPAHVKGELYIPRNPEDNNLQSAQTQFLIEAFGIGKVIKTEGFFAIKTFYDPNAYEGRTVRILRLGYHKVRRGKDYRYATEIHYGGQYAVRYSETLYAAMFKARPSLVRSVKLNQVTPTETGAEILTMTHDHMELRMGTMTDEEILSLHNGSFQCSLMV